MVKAANEITDQVIKYGNYRLSSEDIKYYNSMVLANLAVDDDVIPGETRQHGVTVGRYRGAPAEDCDYLLDRLCAWLSGPDFAPKQGYEVVFGVIKAIVAHLYLAWIHPFGDGNGRTARLLEVRFILEAGAPTPAAHLLSNFYNQTRHEYYRKLDEISKNGGDISPFIAYAVDGLRHELRDQIRTVRSHQFDVTWANYVHEQFKDKKSPTDHRRRHLVLAISEIPTGVSILGLRRMTPKLAELYAGKTSKTAVRDLNALIEMKMLTRRGRFVSANSDLIRAFLPIRRTDHLSLDAEAKLEAA